MAEDNAMDASAPDTGKRDRATVDAVERLDGPARKQEKICRVDTLRFAFAADKELVKRHAQ